MPGPLSFSEREGTMPHKQANRNPVADREEGPVKPGTPMYRLLQLVAREIVRTLAQNTRVKETRRKR